ncbi:MAG: hypothetical protein QNK23_10440 [Crocinitomicaceae bacterium]|nr:hypothetical protein [Crocinitomicaceae bacterium]
MRLLFIGLLFVVSVAQGQIVYDFDTLNYGERMNSSIDSIDISSADYTTSFDGGIAILSPNGLSATSLFRNITEPAIAKESDWKRIQFSALPHLGFSYSFGSQGSQFLKAKYNHAFTQNLVLDLRYNRSSGQGVLRNGVFANNDVKLQLQRRGLRYSMLLKGSFQSYETGHPGGIDSLQDIGLDLNPVLKSNAQSRARIGNVILENYFNFLKDSVNALGLTTRHQYKIRNRLYTETDDIAALYDAVYIDPLDTRDNFNIARISNGAGVYYNNTKLYLQGLVDYTYWKYSNLGVHQESTESDVYAMVGYKLKRLKFSNNLRLNIMGRFNEFSNKFNFTYTGNKIKAGAQFDYEKLAPTVFQRNYFSNNSSYSMTNVSTQNWLRGRVFAGYSIKDSVISLSAYADYATVSNVYEYKNGSWVNDSLKNTMFSIGVKSEMRFGVFNFHPHIVYSTDQGGYLPQFQAYGRLFVKGRLFKAKRLVALIGVDVSYITEFKTKAFTPIMDTYNWQSSENAFDSSFNLHAFFAFGIKEFRFFFRYENIGYFWTKHSNEEATGYPIAVPRMRIGITWDFFN